MSGSAFSAFFWSDWNGDRKVQACSPAAQGLWINMLATMMTESTTPGYLDMGIDRFIKLMRWEKYPVLELLKELEENEVFSKTPDGTIFCRRIVRDAEKAEEISKIKSAAGKLGGRPRKNGTTNGTTNLLLPCFNTEKQKESSRARSNSTSFPLKKESSSSAISSESVTATKQTGESDSLWTEQENYWKEFEIKLRKAAGLENSTKHGLVNLAPIRWLLDSGYDLELDVLPSISRQAIANPKILDVRSWRYFVPGIEDDRAARLGIKPAPAPVALAPSGLPVDFEHADLPDGIVSWEDASPLPRDHIESDNDCLRKFNLSDGRVGLILRDGRVLCPPSAEERAEMTQKREEKEEQQKVAMAINDLREPDLHVSHGKWNSQLPEGFRFWSDEERKQWDLDMRVPRRAECREILAEAGIDDYEDPFLEDDSRSALDGN